MKSTRGLRLHCQRQLLPGRGPGNRTGHEARGVRDVHLVPVPGIDLHGCDLDLGGRLDDLSLVSSKGPSKQTAAAVISFPPTLYTYMHVCAYIHIYIYILIYYIHTHIHKYIYK